MMKKLACLTMLLAPMLTVAACSQEPAEAPAAEETVAATEPTGPMALDGQPSWGTFKVTDADGNVGTFVGNEDGTFTMTNSDGESVTGTWTETTPGQFCQTVDGTETCSTETMEDGVWISTDPDGTRYTIERVEG